MVQEERVCIHLGTCTSLCAIHRILCDLPIETWCCPSGRQSLDWSSVEENTSDNFKFVSASNPTAKDLLYLAKEIMLTPDPMWFVLGVANDVAYTYKNLWLVIRETWYDAAPNDELCSLIENQCWAQQIWASYPWILNFSLRIMGQSKMPLTAVVLLKFESVIKKELTNLINWL